VDPTTRTPLEQITSTQRRPTPRARRRRHIALVDGAPVHCSPVDLRAVRVAADRSERDDRICAHRCELQTVPRAGAHRAGAVSRSCRDPATVPQACDPDAATRASRLRTWAASTDPPFRFCLWLRGCSMKRDEPARATRHHLWVDDPRGYLLRPHAVREPLFYRSCTVTSLARSAEELLSATSRASSSTYQMPELDASSSRP